MTLSVSEMQYKLAMQHVNAIKNVQLYKLSMSNFLRIKHTKNY